MSDHASVPKSRTRRTTVRHLALAVAGAVLVSSVGIVVGLNRATAQDPNTRFSANANGDTYGSALHAASPELEPDLIAAMATNGREGYVYKKDLEPESLQPKNPTEAGQMQADRDKRAGEAFVRVLGDQLNRKFEIGTSTAPVVFSIFDRSVRAGAVPATMDETTARAMTEALGTDVVAAAGGSMASLQRAVRAAMDAATHANDRKIPVYQSDGVTVIGEFIVN